MGFDDDEESEINKSKKLSLGVRRSSSKLFAFMMSDMSKKQQRKYPSEVILRGTRGAPLRAVWASVRSNVFNYMRELFVEQEKNALLLFSTHSLIRFARSRIFPVSCFFHRVM